jgi:hypothetical protein
VPAITLNNDEIAELFSPRARRDETILRKTGDTLVQVMEIARAVAVNILNAALRATQDVVSEPQLLKQAALRIGMKSDEVEMNYLFGWGDKASADEAPYAGCGFMKLDDEPARPFKAYRMLPSQINEVVRPPAICGPSSTTCPAGPPARRTRTGGIGTEHLFGNGPAPEVAPPAPEQSQDPQPRRGSGVTADWGKPPPTTSTDVQDALDKADAARDRLHQAMNENSTRDADLDKQFQDILRGGGAMWTPPNSGDEDPRRQYVFDIVAKSGPDGIGPAAILDAITQLHPGIKPPHPDVIARWLNADPRIHKPRTGRYAIRPDQKDTP